MLRVNVFRPERARAWITDFVRKDFPSVFAGLSASSARNKTGCDMQPRTALVHHWLVTMRGGERVFEALAQLFPSADLFTLVCDRKKMGQSFNGRRVRSSFLQHFPKAAQWYRYY